MNFQHTRHLRTSILSACALASLAAPLPTAFAQGLGEAQYNASAPNNSQVIPAPTSSSTAVMTASVFLYGPQQDMFGVDVIVSGITQSVTELGIYGPATATTTGPLLFNIPYNFVSQTTIGPQVHASILSIPISAEISDAIAGGAAYLQLSTLENPQGEIRAAIRAEYTFCHARPASAVQPGCTGCPCSNSPSAFAGGCVNSEGRSAVLFGSGVPSVTLGNYAINIEGAASGSVALLLSGSTALPLQPSACNAGSGISGMFFDGMRCVGGSVLRHGTIVTDASGASLSAAFTPLTGANSAAMVPGQSRYFQAVYRDTISSGCGTGLNTTNGLRLSAVL